MKISDFRFNICLVSANIDDPKSNSINGIETSCIKCQAYPYCAVTNFFCVDIFEMTISTTPIHDGSASLDIK